MTLPPAETPLYNHPLPEIEAWLTSQGCQQDQSDLHRWLVARIGWDAEIIMEAEELTVRYVGAGRDGSDVVRSFKYSLSRQDLDQVIFSGP
ncbi:MAG: DUF3143 domain-containing protein [Kaiparowitsia implicata GSE-PSE-MK54-09C]|jgi:hypothetical protein|nr:DUF3143 domain-containing protein [Kaiparowitsia implicata GSE-PSE-MK54-09C]